MPLLTLSTDSLLQINLLLYYLVLCFFNTIIVGVSIHI